MQQLEAEVKRGVSPEILLTQVRNTIPFLFEPGFQIPSASPHLALLHQFENRDLDHLEYFRLCLAAHHATVASFVPTDVDNQIRFRLWSPTLPTETLIQMSELVLESRAWSSLPVSTRWVQSPESNRVLSGHDGEWFSTAAGAYSALRRKAPEQAAKVAAEIVREVQFESDVFEEFRRARDGMGMLKCATLIAHNLGDLDRVIDMWNLPVDDALREAVYKQGHEGSKRKSLFFAGELNKLCMADENHRNFALRGPRCLRKNAEFLLPIGPFYDAWGFRLARHPQLRPEEVAEVVEALIDGWQFLAKPVGYSRALAGILQNFPGGFTALSRCLPAKVERTLKAGPLRTLVDVPRARFEDQWTQRALKFKV